MAGVHVRKGRDGKRLKKYSLWYIDCRGERVYKTGTTNKQQTLKLAQELEDEHRRIRLGLAPAPKSMKATPIDEAFEAYYSWGDVQGGRQGYPWSPEHARDVRSKLKFWKKWLKLETTSDLIAGTAKRLKQQGAEIHKQAAATQIDMGALQSAFRDIHAALDDISRFRQQALPKMAQTIQDMDKLTTEGEKRIQEMETASIAAEDVFEIIPDSENW